MTPGQAFAAERRARGLTQEQVGTILGATDRTVREWERAGPPRYALAYLRALESIGPAWRVTVDFELMLAEGEARVGKAG